MNHWSVRALNGVYTHYFPTYEQAVAFARRTAKAVGKCMDVRRVRP